MFAETLSPAAVQTFYNRLGARHDAADWYEGAAKRCALAALALRPGQRVLNVGVGTGKEHYQIMTAVGPLGLAVGLDLATVMLALTRARTGTPLLRADARHLPLLDGVFDRVYAAYILDLIPLADLPGMLRELRRMLRPGGQAVLVSLTEGETLLSRAVIAGWKLAFQIDPMLCGGCRPLQLASLAQEAGFTLGERIFVAQAGMPSEVLVLTGSSTR
jgi:ubiquinone/menaquinone biosynthesis C-methylase UbiE